MPTQSTPQELGYQVIQDAVFWRRSNCGSADLDSQRTPGLGPRRSRGSWRRGSPHTIPGRRGRATSIAPHTPFVAARYATLSFSATSIRPERKVPLSELAIVRLHKREAGIFGQLEEFLRRLQLTPQGAQWDQSCAGLLSGH